MKRVALVSAVITAAGLLAGVAGAEDLTIVFQTTGPGGGGTSTQYLTSDRMRTSDGQTDMVYEFAAGRMTMIDHAKKQYSETTLAEIEAAMAAVNPEMEKMKAQLDGMPAAMREKMQAMMGGGGEVTLTKGGTREVAGYSTQEYTIARGDSMKMQVWTTSALRSPVSVADVRRFASFGSAASMANNPMFEGMSAMMEKMKEVEGFTLADSSTFTMMGRAMQSSREATEVREGAIPASTFDLAALAPGYEKVESPFARMGRR